jgi:hypothetical protein
LAFIAGSTFVALVSGDLGFLTLIALCAALVVAAALFAVLEERRALKAGAPPAAPAVGLPRDAYLDQLKGDLRRDFARED